jgi:hypothetical protein
MIHTTPPRSLTSSGGGGLTGATRMSVNTRSKPEMDNPQHTPEFVLYVHAQCASSDRLLSILKSTPMPNILLQNVHLLTECPVWLCGTPMLVDTKLGLLYKGSDVFMLVNHMTNASPRESVPEKKTNNGSMDSLFRLPDDDF